MCPRLTAFRAANRVREPAWFNAPVPSWGPAAAPLLIVGLAPGLRGANRTGRPFNGDASGALLFATLQAFGLADPELAPTGCRVANAVRCVPPGNLPVPAETAACNGFLRAEIVAMPNLRTILALGQLAHVAVLRALALHPAAARFRHGAVNALPGGITLADSYHPSRLNTNTGRLTPAMFAAVVALCAASFSPASAAPCPAASPAPRSPGACRSSCAPRPPRA